MDVWAIVLNRTVGLPMTNWAMPGRWFAHLFKGQVFHADIGQASTVSGEMALGWAVHYGVGAIYGIAWVLIAGPIWLAEPTFFPVWIFALVTIAAGWFLLQPGMRLGWAASKTPNPWKVRGLGLLAHTAFGFGMWIVAVALA